MRPFLAATTIMTVCGMAVCGMAGCGEQQIAKPTPAQASEESFTQIGDYQLHYNALITTHLAPEVAQSYGIKRSKTRALLNVSLLHKSAEHAHFEPVSADLSVEAYNLIGQPKSIAMRRVTVDHAAGSAISYIGELSISNNETLVFNIKATPSQTTQTLNAKFKHQFFID